VTKESRGNPLIISEKPKKTEVGTKLVNLEGGVSCLRLEIDSLDGGGKND